MEPDIQQRLARLYEDESRRVLATLIRLLGSFELAEEALHDAFLAATVQWPKEGEPDNPRAWLVSTGRFKAIDQLRRKARFDDSLDYIADSLYQQAEGERLDEDSRIEDDRLRLIFTCCHPSLSPEAQIALTLREVCDLTTEEIARAFLTTPSTLAQRIVRAKRKIQSARIPYEVPGPAELPERLGEVLQVVYLVFNEGYSSSFGEQLSRLDLAEEAIRLGRLLMALLPEPDVEGLLALMLLHQSRRPARTSSEGELVLLEEQDRNLWDAAMIAEGDALVRHALMARRVGPYTLQAAIAALHAGAPTASDTDWNEIVGFYNLLQQAHPSPIVDLNRAVAMAMRDGPQAGLLLIDELQARGKLSDYHLLYAARADLSRRLGDVESARKAYERAIALCRQTPERRFLEKRLKSLADLSISASPHRQ